MTTIASNLPETAPVSSGITFLLALSCGLIAANLYYAQPLVGPIAAELGIGPQAAGLIVTMTQLGYGAGLLLIVPLGDLIGTASWCSASSRWRPLRLPRPRP